MHKLDGKVFRVLARPDCWIAVDLEGHELERGRYWCARCLHTTNDRRHACGDEQPRLPAFYFSAPSAVAAG